MNKVQTKGEVGSDTNKSGLGIAKSALSMALGTFSSRILGLLRDILMAASFSTVMTDAWLVAYRLPNLFRRLFGEGALSVSFIPIFMDIKENQGEEASKQFSNSIFTILFIILLALSSVCFVFAEPIIKLLAGTESFYSIPEKFENTVRFARIMSFFLLFICLFAYLMAVLNSLKHFYQAAFAPMLLNVALIVAAVLPKEWINISGDYLAWGALIGGFMQMAVLLPHVKRLSYFPKFQLSFSQPEVKKVFKNMIPGFISMGILQITTLINVYFASTLENGTNSWIYYADRLLELPLSLIAVSLGTALLPSLSQLWANQQKEEFLKTTQKFIRLTMFLAIPSGVGLILLGKPIIEIIFMRGKFDQNSANMTSQILQVYGVALMFYSVSRIFNVSFYALKKVWYPVVASVLGLIVHLSLVQYLMAKWGVIGLISSTTISGAVSLFVVFLMFHFKVGKLSLVELSMTKTKIIIAALAMYPMTRFYYLLTESIGNSFVIKVVSLSISIACAAMIYFLIHVLFKTEELMFFIRRFRKKK